MGVKDALKINLSEDNKQRMVFVAATCHLHNSLYTRTIQHFYTSIGGRGRKVGFAGNRSVPRPSLLPRLARPCRQADWQAGEQVRSGLPFIWRGSLPSSGRWRLPRPSAVSAAPRGGTVCCWVCWSPSPSWSLSQWPKWSLGRGACPTVLLGLSPMIWGVVTEDVFCLPGGAWAGALGLWADPSEGRAGVGQVPSYHGLCLETWPFSC